MSSQPHTPGPAGAGAGGGQQRAGSGEQPGPASGPDPRQREPSEEELRAAYEAELARITCSDLMLQAAVSLLNLGGRRLGAPPGAQGGEGEAAGSGRDLEQARDAIDGVRALLGVLERRFSNELAPLRDALSQLQIAYAREAQAAAAAPAQAPAGSGQSAPAEGETQRPKEPQDAPQPGPAEASGRLWVPGR